MWIRHVLVPGITDNDEYLKKTREFIDTLDTVMKVEVLPHHTLGIQMEGTGEFLISLKV